MTITVAMNATDRLAEEFSRGREAVLGSLPLF
jgi:hypothetical protein